MASKTYAPGKKEDTDNNSVAELVGTAQEKTKPLQQFFMKFANDWSFAFAGNLAYSLLLAILPIAIAVVSIFGFIVGGQSSQNFLDQIIGSINVLSGSKDLIKQGLNNLSNQAGFLGLIALLTAIFGGSRLFIGMEGFLDIIYRVRPRTFIPQNIMAILMTVLFVIMVPIMFFAATLPSLLLNFVQDNPAVKSIPFLSFVANNAFITFLAGVVGSLIASFILFIAIYIVVPNQRINVRNSWKGAAVAAVALQLFISVVFPFYSTHFLGNYTGQAGLAVVLLVFFYYFAVILLLGAEVNAFFSEKVKPLPNDLATFVSTMGGKLNKDIPDSESPAHMDTHPTDSADRARIAETRMAEEENRRKNAGKQHSIAAKGLARDRKKKQAQVKEQMQPGRGVTILSAVVGSLLALIIELLRLRQHRK